MKIAFFTESRYYGKVPEGTTSMRTDLAWVYLLNADHIYMYDFSKSMHYDLGIIIIPKNRVDVPIDKIKNSCTKIAIMQEGPANYWTDYTMYDQIQHLTLLNSADFLLVHNDIDINYFSGLTGKRCYIMPSAMVESLVDSNLTIKQIEDRKNIIIGGNMCAWYNGMISYVIASQYAKHFNQEIWAPSMGRKISGEERLDGLKHLPYMDWTAWMQHLNNFSVGVHMMPTAAAGTFSLNCAYLGIPCIGNMDIDTQRICHPDLSFKCSDIIGALEAIDKLKDPDFRKECREYAINSYYEEYHSRLFAGRMNNIFESELNK